jgi:Flp pilus assembly protein protease CpaA
MPMFAVATFVLIAGLIDDLRSRKVSNNLVLLLFACAAGATLYFRGLDGSMPGLGAMLLALVITIPLFSMRILGGGDVKLFAVFALAVDPTSMFWTLVYSFVWGSLFGLTKSVLDKQLLLLVRNTYKLAARQKLQTQELQKIPYTFALLLGWFTQLTLMRMGGAL